MILRLKVRKVRTREPHLIHVFVALVLISPLIVILQRIMCCLSHKVRKHQTKMVLFLISDNNCLICSTPLNETTQCCRQPLHIDSCLRQWFETQESGGLRLLVQTVVINLRLNCYKICYGKICWFFRVFVWNIFVNSPYLTIFNSFGLFQFFHFSKSKKYTKKSHSSFCVVN